MPSNFMNPMMNHMNQMSAPRGVRPGHGQMNMMGNMRMQHQQQESKSLESIIPGRSTLDDRISTDYEEEQSRLLDHILENEINTFMTQEQWDYKESVLVKIRAVLEEWMKRVKKKHGYSEDMTENGSCKLLPYGSFKLGVSSVSGDIDSLIIAPHYVDRHDDFFGCLYPLLKEMAETDKRIEDLTAVDQENTIMPLIKMTYYDVQIDLVFAHVNDMDKIEELIKGDNDQNEEIINNMVDDKMRRSYKGFRDAEMIIQSLHREEDPPEINHRREAVFRTTLKCVKLWSKKNGLDSNKCGYLGGIAWALLTAKICQLYPYESPAKLLERFFWLYGNEWNWDEWFVRIIKPKDEEGSRIKQRFMHVMTPAWP